MKMIDLKLNQSSFEGLSATHPPWQERIRLTDKEQAKLWKAMAAFHDGAVFLMTEQFILAERCFERVTREFPDCYEAWANLGYAKLMMYCDALDTPDLRRFDVGHLVLGGFYLRPKSLGPELRGVDEDLWFAAVGALRESLRLKPDQALAKANLGLAYLLRPAGKDVGKATQFLDEAAELAARDESLDPMVRVALLINGGVAEMAGGREKEVLAKFEKAEQLAKKAVATARTPSPKVSGALLYNRALMLAGAKDDKSQRQALDMLEKYLRTTSPASAWWPLAYARYTRLCKTLELAPRSEKELQKSAPGTPRLVASVKLPSGTVVGLTEPLEAVVKQLGKGTAVPVMADTNLHRVHYPDHGIDLIVTDNVLAIYLLGPKAPALPLRGKGLGEKGPELKVGMTKAALEAALGEEDYEFIELERRDVNYRFYRRVGLAVRLTQNRVSEMVIVQFPERRLQ
jgi:tetratricopeptide (TPR) repeat protein